MATAARNFAEQQRAAELAQSAALNPAFSDGDAALAAELQKGRETDAERARLTSEDAKRDYDNLVKANRAKVQQQAQDQKDEIDRYHANNEAQDQRTRQKLDAAWATMLDSATPKDNNVHTMDMNRLRAVSMLADRTANFEPEAVEQLNAALDPMYQTQQLAAQQPERNQRPETFPDGSLVQIKDNADGTLEAKLITGEVFRGDPMTVTRKIGEAQVNTKRWGQQQRATAQQPAQQPANGNAAASPNSATTFDANGQPVVDFSKIPDVTRYQMDQMAMSLGFKDGEEMVQDQIAQRQRTDRLEQQLADERSQREMRDTSSSFLVNAPDFPNTDQSIAALEQIIAANGWEWNSQNMLAAHSLAVRNHIYQPLNTEQQLAANGHEVRPARPTPPPMVRSGSPDANRQDSNPYAMPLQDLRALAITQALEGKS